MPFYSYLDGGVKFFVVLLEILNNKSSVQRKTVVVVSDSPGLVDFTIGLVNSVFNLPVGQVIFF